MRDSKALTDQVEYFTPPNELEKEKARKAVCSNAIDSQDADTLLRMLGLHPSEPVEDLIPVSMISHLGSAR